MYYDDVITAVMDGYYIPDPEVEEQEEIAMNAMTAVSELSTSCCDVLTYEDMFEIFGYHMYQVCVNRICA